MMNLRVYLFQFLLLTSAAVTTPFVLSNTSEVANAVAEWPVVGRPDLRLKIQIQWDGRKFPLISCLMNTVEFLGILGMGDFLGRIEQLAWKLEEYPEVGIIVSPSTEGGRIERRFVIWGLSQGVAHMIHSKRFETVTITLSCTYLSRRSSPIQTLTLLLTSNREC